MKKIRLLPVLFLMFLFSCVKEEPEPFNAPKNILIIGNSYTFFNNGLSYHLNKYVTNEASLHVDRVKEVAKGGYTLENHWNDTATVNTIKRGGWDVIILQEQSLRPVNEKEKMFLYSQKFDSLIKSTGDAKLYFFMTWAYKSYPDMIYPLSESYNQAAKNAKANVIPVGLEWDKLLNSKDSLNLYYSDGQHPNINGTFFTATIFYKILFGKNPVLNQYRDTLISNETANLLKEWGNKSEAIQY